MSVLAAAAENVRFRLSPDGKVALAEVFEASAFQAKMVGADELGVWIDLGDGAATLLKWQYLATMAVTFSVPDMSQPTSKRMGFKFEPRVGS